MRTIMVALLLAVSQAPVSVEQEPQHRLALVNDYVRVLDVIFPPGYMTLFHTHALDNVSVRFTPGTSRTDRPDAQGAPAPVIPGSVAFNGASPPYTHRILNTGTNTIHILDVQLVKGTAAASVADALAGHEIVIENDRVRVSRVKLAAGEVLPAHSHPRGWVEATVAGEGAGSFRWHDAGTTPAALNGPAEVVEIEPKNRPAAMFPPQTSNLLVLNFRELHSSRTGLPMATNREHGFTLIELLIVVAIIGVIAAFAVPGLMHARMSGFETSALASMTTTRDSQVAYSVSCGNGNFATSYAVLGTPPPSSRDAYISADLGHPDPVQKSGYNFTLAAGAGSTAGPNDCNGAATVTSWFATAVPQQFATTGNKSFAVDNGNTVWQSLAAAAPTQPFTESATVSPVK